MTTMRQRESTIAVPDDRRKQLGAFLRARRESLDPQRRGCPGWAAGARRVCAGKRWRCSPTSALPRVHWLEQGREVNPSEAVLVGGWRMPCSAVRWRPGICSCSPG